MIVKNKAVLEELQRTTCRKTVITQVEFFSVLLWESFSSENLVAMFFFCNTHYVVAGAQFLWWGWIWICCSVLPSIRLAVLLNGPNLSTPTPPPLGLVEWMTMSHCGGLVLADWWVIDVMADCGGSGAEEEPSPQEQEKIQECWGWWRGSPHLSQWRHAESEMYRIYPFFFLLLFTLCLSHTLVVWFLFPNINLEAEVFG